MTGNPIKKWVININISLNIILCILAWSQLSYPIGKSNTQEVTIPDTLLSGRVFHSSKSTPLVMAANDGNQTKEQRKPHKNRIYYISGFDGLALAGVYAAHIKPWWSGEKNGIRFKYDFYNNYWLEMDKFGHFYANIQVAKLSAALFQYAGVERRKALWIGFANTTLLYTSFELTDAGFEDWGFSVPDYIANLLGAFYPLAQHYWPVLNHFNFKISYWPSKYFRSDQYQDTPGFTRFKPYQYVVGDYDGMIFWLSADVDWLLPKFARLYWPNWLDVAIGYGAGDLPQANMEVKERHLYLALDYDLTCLPGKGAFFQKLKGVLNAIHFPAPAIRIASDGTVAYLLHF
jgi:hypothetical protein